MSPLGAVSRNLARFRYTELVTNLGKILLSTAKASLCRREAGWRGRKVQGGNLRATVPRSYFSVLYNFYFRMMRWTAEIQISMKIWSSHWQLKFAQLQINGKKISCNLSNCKLTRKKFLICNCLNYNYHRDVSDLHSNLTSTLLEYPAEACTEERVKSYTH